MGGRGASIRSAATLVTRSHAPTAAHTARTRARWRVGEVIQRSVTCLAAMQQAERSERSRALILEAALRLFSARGYRGTSIRDIADGAGVTTGNLYHQFPD